MMGFIFLGLLCPVYTGPTLLHGGPVGIALCKRICETMFGCKSFTYLPLSLKCYSGKLENEEKAVTQEIQNTLSTNVAPDTCRNTSRIIESRSKKPVCFKQRNMQDPKENEIKPIRFKYHSKNLAYAEAKTKCEEEGGSMAQFQHGFNKDTIKQIFKGNPYVCAVIGLTYHKKVEKFKWDDGTPYLDNDRWEKNEPTHSLFSWAEENCVCMTKSSLLKDIPCASASDYICQIPMEPFTTA